MIPKVSIIIACYNDSNVVTAVKSANDQTYLNKEIILVDDGSNSQVAQIIQSLKNEVDLIIVQKNQGQSVARNNGIKKAKGKYILNLDSDDFFEPSFCEKAILEMERDPEVKIVTCNTRRFHTKGDIDIFTPRGGCITNFLVSNAALGSAMFKKADWEECGGYEEKLPILGFEDWEFYINILKNDGRAHVIKELLFNYQVRENSTTARIRNEKQDKFQHIIFKHEGLYKQNFEVLVNDLFDKIKKKEKDKLKAVNTIDYKLGNKLLKPLRYLKSKWK